MQEPRFERMDISMLDEVLEIENSNFSDPWTREIYENELAFDIAEYYVLKLDNEIIGYFGIWKVVGEANITNISVKKEFRGKGYGNLMMEFLINRVKELKYYGIQLEVRKSNEVAKKLYEKMGFKEIGIRKEYYTIEHEDAIVMWKTLLSEEII